ncbi:MAG: hypothetical protein C4303_07775, partial [candidate division GAL15 bacterium]
LLSAGLQPPQAWLAAVLAGSVLGLVGAAGAVAPKGLVRPLLAGLGAGVSLGMFQELVLLVLQPEGLAAVREWLFVASGGPTAHGVGAVALASAAAA